MRIKNVNFVEMHVEKIVLALAVLFSAGVVWAYVWGVPYTTPVGADAHAAPDQIEQKVLAEQRQLSQLIGPGSPSPLPDMRVPAYTAMFQRRLQQPPFAAERLDPISQPGLAYNQFRLPDRPIDDQFEVPTPNAPLWPKAIAGFGVLRDNNHLTEHFTQLARRAQNPEPQQYGQAAAQMFDTLAPAKNEPRDFRYVTVAALYNIEAWRQSLEANTAIPDDWWRGNTAIVDVVLERQTFNNTTGQWGDPVTLPPTPGAGAFHSEHTTWTKQQAKQAVDTAIKNQEQIQRPEFVPMTSAAQWSPPDIQPDGLSFQIQQQADMLIKEIEHLKDRIRRAPSGEQSIFDLTDPANAGVGAMSVKQLKQQLETKAKQLASLKEQTQQLSEQAPAPADLNDSYKWWRLWAHDYQVLPSQTYRYRVRVSLINPLFQRSQLAAQQRQEYFHTLTLQSGYSEWSQPVSIEPTHRFFLVGGSGAEMQARVEVWRVINGKPRKAEFRVKAGDPIGGVVEIEAGKMRVEADMRIDALVVDLTDTPSTQNLGQRTTQMLYLDLNTDQLEHRVAELDRESSIYKWLESLSSSDAAVAEANGLAGRGVR